MQKKKILSIIIACVMLFVTCSLCACDNGGLTSLSKTGESSGLETEKSPLELSDKEVLFAFIEKVNKVSSYEIDAVGTSTTKVLLVNATQNINAKTKKNGNEYYSFNKTDSTFVHTSFCAFFKNGKVAYDDKNTEPKSLTVTTESEYRDIYGVLPSDKSINGFIVNDETVISVEKVSENADDTITYKITLDGNKAGANVQKQMKQFGGLNTYPDFKKTCFTLIIKKDWTPVSLIGDFSYVISASFVSNATCFEQVTYSYSNVNGKVDIPDRETFINELKK